MKDEDKIAFKIILHKKCMSIIEERMNSCYEAMENAQASANNEEKSSAGDKYETGRAMSHLEKDMHAKQLITNKKHFAAVSVINCNKIYTTVSAGSVVKCNECFFFLAAGLGKIFIEGKLVFLISSNSALSYLLQHSKIGDSFLFGEKELIIEEVF